MIRNEQREIKVVFRSGLLRKYCGRFVETALIYRYLTGNLEVIYGRIARGSPWLEFNPLSPRPMIPREEGRPCAGERDGRTNGNKRASKDVSRGEQDRCCAIV